MGKIVISEHFEKENKVFRAMNNFLNNHDFEFLNIF